METLIVIKTNNIEWYDEHLQTGDKYVAFNFDKGFKDEILDSSELIKSWSNNVFKSLLKK